MVAVLLIEVGGLGCHQAPRRVSEFWGAVPYRWSSSRVEPQPEPVVEPSVTANVAASVEKSPSTEISSLSASRERDTKSESTLHSSSSPSSVIAAGHDPSATRSTGFDQTGLGFESHDPAVTTSSFADSSGDQIERLKAALNDDLERAKDTPRHAGGAHDVRVRVEQMLDRARKLVDLGQLREARHTAKTAHDLGDSVRLDYLPDEERPIDLVQRIDDQLREQTIPSDISAETSETSVTNGSVPKVSVAAKENEAASKARLDWTNPLTVFRRDRKLAPNPIPVTPVAAPTNSASDDTVSQVQLGLETDADSADGAVVQANRSVTLVKNREADSPQSADSAESANVLPNDAASDDIRQPDATTEPEIEAPLSPTAWAREVGESQPREIPSDITGAPTDFEEVEPISTFRDLSDQVPLEPPTSSDDSVEPPRRGWLIGSILFGVCAAVAIFWYRRGAT